MAGVIRVFGWGAKGVNLVKSPLELDNDEVTQAQNAEPFREQGQFGIRKRFGLQKVVPTGNVAPGALPGPVYGIITIPDTIGLLSPTSQPVYVPITITGGIFTLNPVLGFNPYTTPVPGVTPPSPSAPLIGLLPNVKYKLTASSPYEFVTQFPAVPIGMAMMVIDGGQSVGRTPWGIRDWVFGGHQSGEVLRYNIATQVLSRFVQLGGGVGLDDCLILPNPYLYNKPRFAELFGQSAAVVAMTNGAISLVSNGANGPVILTLPALAAQAMGSSQLADWLLVTSGSNIMAIRPGIDTAWVTAATVPGTETLLGIAPLGAFVYVGTKTSTITTMRIRKYTLASNSTGQLSIIQSGGLDSLQIVQTAAPTYFFGPIICQGGLYCIYKGTNGATLSGSEGGGGTTGQRSVIRGTVNGTGSGVTWNTDTDLTTQYGGSTNITLGPLTEDLQLNVWTMGRYNITSLAILRSGIQSILGGGAFAWERVYNSDPGAEVQFPMLPV